MRPQEYIAFQNYLEGRDIIDVAASYKNKLHMVDKTQYN